MIKIIVKKEGAINHNSELDNLYQSDNVLILGNNSVRKLKGENGTTVLFSGVAKYRRDGEACVEDVDMASARFRELVAHLPIDQCKKQLEGRYILARVQRNGTVEITNDRYGKMDLYYGEMPLGFVFGCNLALIKEELDDLHYDQFGLMHSLYVYGFRPPKQHTLYSNIKRLGIEQYFVFDGQGRFNAVAPYIAQTNSSYSDRHLHDYYHIWVDALERLSSPLGNVVYLSSGWDSTSIVAGLVHLHGAKNVRCVIGRFMFSDRSGIGNPFELKRAQALCDYYGVQLDVVDINHAQRAKDFVSRWQPFQQQHMFAGLSFYLWTTLAEFVEKNYKGKAVFSGEISDGVHNFGFSQHTTILGHKDLAFREYSDKMVSYLFSPEFLSSFVSGDNEKDVVFNLIQQQHQGKIFDEPTSNQEQMIKSLFSSMFARDVRVPLYSLENVDIFTSKGAGFYNENINQHYFDEAAKSATPDNLISWYIYLYNTFHWQGGTVTTLGYTADELGFDMNLPFYDSRIQDFLAKAPTSWGRGLEIVPTKYPLKWVLKNKVDYPMHLQVGPHSYIYDVDPDFNFAGEFIYQSAYTPIIKDILKDHPYETVLSSDLFNIDYYNIIVNNYLSGNEVPQQRGDLSALCFMTLAGFFS